MINSIHQDHKNMMGLLQVLDHKATLLQQEKKIDYQVVMSILMYLKKYADKYHHPLEDLIYSYYLSYKNAPEIVANRLSKEHKKLKVMTTELIEIIQQVLLDAIVSNKVVSDKLTLFITSQMQHLDYEEQEILPTIKKNLTPDDWENLRQQWLHYEHVDPLFGDKVSEEFKVLAELLH